MANAFTVTSPDLSPQEEVASSTSAYLFQGEATGWLVAYALWNIRIS